MKRFKARPFLKWAGGKTQLLAQFREYYPEELGDKSITRYVEPFLGSGAVFLDIVQRFSISEAFLFDVNRELILTFLVVQQRPQDLIFELQKYKKTYFSLPEDKRSKFYYTVREKYNAHKQTLNHDSFRDEWVQRAATTIFLNKTCYNGLFRVNSKGEFNVPFGRYARPKIVDEENILAVSKHLQIAHLQIGSFEACENFIDDQSFVYFDPPYRPLSSTANFTTYYRKDFTDLDQIQLAHFYSRLNDTKKAKLMLSNADPQNSDPNDRFFEDLYSDFTIQKVQASRMINSNAGGRGKITEILVTNY